MKGAPFLSQLLLFTYKIDPSQNEIDWYFGPNHFDMSKLNFLDVLSKSLVIFGGKLYTVLIIIGTVVQLPEIATIGQF